MYGSTTPAIYWVRLFVTKLIGWKSLTIVTKRPTLDLQRVLDLPLLTSSGRNKFFRLKNEAFLCRGKLNTQWKWYSFSKRKD